MREFDLIDLLRQRLTARRTDTHLGIGDDCALLAPPPGHELAVTTDTLVSGRHFPVDTPASDIGYKAIAVNLSDLAAMGITPAWMTLSLAAPALEYAWCQALLDGICAATEEPKVDIVGGDTTRSEVLTLSVTAMGYVPDGQALRRDTARPGDLIAVTGTLGDAAAGLALWPERETASSHERWLISRLTRPTPRKGCALRGMVHGVADISDGLLADLGHILHASQVGATVNIDALPCSKALAEYAPDIPTRRQLQAASGDDYELCLTLDPSTLSSVQAALDCPVTVIGEIDPQPGLRLKDAKGQPVIDFPTGHQGWDHFATNPVKR